MDPKLILSTLGALDDNILATVMGQLLQQKPELAPGLVSLAVPELTYAPTKAFTEKRCSGSIKKLHPALGMAYIDCPELSQVFGCDVVVHATQVGAFVEGTEVNFAVTLNDENKPQAFDLQENSTPSIPSTGPMGAIANLGAMSTMGAMDVKSVGPMGAMNFLDGMGLQGKGPINQEVLGEFYGIVKSYNAEKGFGFIVCDALKSRHDGDVYLHSRHVGDFKVGQEVKFTAYLHNGRLQGRELQDATGMVGPQTGAAPGLSDEQELGVFVGKIKNFNHEKGFGFIVCEALNLQGYQGDVFLHSKHKGTFDAGDEVAFMAVLRSGKLQGKDLQASGAFERGLNPMGVAMGGPMGAMGMAGMAMMGDHHAKRARMY